MIINITKEANLTKNKQLFKTICQLFMELQTAEKKKIRKTFSKLKKKRL